MAQNSSGDRPNQSLGGEEKKVFPNGQIEISYYSMHAKDPVVGIYTIFDAIFYEDSIKNKVYN